MPGAGVRAGGDDTVSGVRAAAIEGVVLDRIFDRKRVVAEEHTGALESSLTDRELEAKGGMYLPSAAFL